MADEVAIQSSPRPRFSERRFSCFRDAYDRSLIGHTLGFERALTNDEVKNLTAVKGNGIQAKQW